MPRKPRNSTRPPGKPPFEPTKAQRQMVAVLRGAGTAPEVIARLLEISPPTLSKYFAHELAHGKSEIVARIGGKCISKALAGDNACIAFYLKNHGGPAWRDKSKVEHSGPGGKPLATGVTIQVTDPVEAARIYQRMIDGE